MILGALLREGEQNLLEISQKTVARIKKQRPVTQEPDCIRLAPFHPLFGIGRDAAEHQLQRTLLVSGRAVQKM